MEREAVIGTRSRASDMQETARPGTKRRFGTLMPIALCWVASVLVSPAWAQGQDSTPGERYLQVMAELLPGDWSNANQAYFDRRRGLPDDDRHDGVQLRIRPVTAPAFGPHVFLWETTVTSPDGEERVGHRIAALAAEGAPDEVVMRHWFRLDGPIDDAEIADLQPDDLQRTEGCDYRFRRRAGGFRGAQDPGACRFEWEGEAVFTDNVIELGENELFMHDHKFRVADGERFTGVASGEPYWLERARTFHCYVDMPGVGGGRDEPFERYDGITLHDKGGSHWFTTREDTPRRIGVSLLQVTWHVLNENNGNFNRDSLVVYVSEEGEGGQRREHGYAFTEPDAERIGVNLKWLLVNCSLVPRDQARPEL